MAAHRDERRLPRVGGGRAPHRLLALLAVVLVVAGTTWFSGATFTSATDTPTTVRAAADYYAPKVAVVSPGTVVTGTTTVSATASDTGTGVASVRIEHAVADSGAWVALCTDTTAPYTCSWTTTSVADGDYQLRATALDNAGSSATSTTVTTRVANNASVTLGTIADVVRGSVPLSATVTGANGRTVSTTFSYVNDAGAATAITGCQGMTSTTPSCTWNTGTLADTYSVRATTTFGTGTTAITASNTRADVVVDNLPPTVTVDAPAPMSGTVLVTTAPVDDDSGIGTVEVQYRAITVLGPGAWTSVCTASASPYRCSLDTTRLTSGSDHELRAIATDVAGNTTTSASITRRVSNGLASVTITSPVTGDVVRGTTTITTDTAVPLGASVTRVLVEGRLAGGTYAAICTDTTAPYTCDWATAGLASGTWELRATMTYGLTASTVVSPVVSVTVDNTPLRATDVQARNGGTLGRVGAGDTLTLTYTGSVAFGSVKSGWAGESTSITVTLNDKNRVGAVNDRATFTVNLGHVAFEQNYVRKNRSVAVPATMTGTTATTNGVTTTTIVITIGTTTSTDLVTATTRGTMTWTPSGAVTSVGGTASSTTPATESGALDSDL